MHISYFLKHGDMSGSLTVAKGCAPYYHSSTKLNANLHVVSLVTARVSSDVCFKFKQKHKTMF